MNISLNLATRPYLELRSVYARLRVVAVVLLVLALPMLLVLHVAETKARLAEARVDQLQSNIALLRRQSENARALASQGPNANILTQAAFLNDLYRRKAFSWTATMSDLESTLPYGVQVMVIDPVIAPDGHITIRMRVTGVRERAVEVVHDLEHSRHFIAPRLVAEALANQNNAGPRSVSLNPGSPADVSFDILADYRPLPNSHDQAGVRAASQKNSHANGPASRIARAQLTNPDPSSSAVSPTGLATQRSRHPRSLPKPFAGSPTPSGGLR
jgi:type IV pilus assembly protein PilN